MKCLKFYLLFLIVPIISIGQTPKKAETVALSNTNIYYEIHGEGEPLFLLHGYTMSSKYWLPDIRSFAEDFEVYLVDLTGHGKSGAFKEEFSINSVAEDLIELIDYLELNDIKGIGYSYGGDVLFHLASMKPDIIEAMVTIGGIGIKDLTKFPKKLKFLSIKNLDNIPWIWSFQIDDDHVRPILEHIQNYTITLNDAELKKINARTLIIAGDNDQELPLETLAKVRELVKDSDLWIVPNSGHNAHEGKNRDLFIQISKEFLKGKHK